MSEKDILYENGDFWVMKSQGYYYVMKNGLTHAISENTAYADLSIAKARVDYLARRKP
jgi:hypothetical protein